MPSRALIRTDQGALNGVLSALYERHLPVIAVECLDGEESE